jgi:hypothetical protein
MRLRSDRISVSIVTIAPNSKKLRGTPGVYLAQEWKYNSQLRGHTGSGQNSVMRAIKHTQLPQRCDNPMYISTIRDLINGLMKGTSQIFSSMVSSLSLFLAIRIPIGSEFKAYMGGTARSITTAGY